MKTQILLSKISRTKLTSALFAAAMLVGSSTAFAQVKIGTNPTTIEPNSNLEVEASTPGRKTKIDKTTGQVTITDGTEGAGKVLTSDAAGGTSWQNPLAGAMVNGTTGNQVTVTNTGTFATYSGATITLPRAGTYMVTAQWTMPTASTVYPVGNQAFINTALSTSPSTYDAVGVAAEWMVIAGGAYHTTPSFRVTVAGPQTLYFWFQTGFFSGELRFTETYAVGPF
ncbi:hypothetical protein [Dyadobacter sp. SG02]|uniref:hypothetical protein n=1 Tax=Dyadobacter sp. SG02 TaxID=1855291 RepID=UPI000ACC297B|nr:hypothetical protein [Dyadobacter sp. SG02]